MWRTCKTWLSWGPMPRRSATDVGCRCGQLEPSGAAIERLGCHGAATHHSLTRTTPSVHAVDQQPPGAAPSGKPFRASERTPSPSSVCQGPRLNTKAGFRLLLGLGASVFRTGLAPSPCPGRRLVSFGRRACRATRGRAPLCTVATRGHASVWAISKHAPQSRAHLTSPPARLVVVVVATGSRRPGRAACLIAQDVRREADLV